MGAIESRACLEADGIKEILSRIELDPDYAELLAGKRVILVGPAETLIGKGRGGVIDSYDLVVRLNTATDYMPFRDELRRDIGSRLDLFYFNNEIMTYHILGQKEIPLGRFARLCNDFQVKYMTCTNNDFTYAREGEAEPGCFREGAAFNSFLKQQVACARFRMLFSTSLAAREILGGFVARTGFLAILDLLCYPVKELSITGMTFYHKGGHLFFKDHAPELHPLKDHLGMDTNKGTLGHNSYLELEMTRRLAKAFEPVLTADEQLQKLFEDSAAQ